MKLWVKFLIGLILGFAAAFIIPMTSQQSTAVLNFIMQIALRFGRYMVVPLLFFAVMNSTFQLSRSKNFLKASLWTISTILLSSLLLTFIGTISIIFIHLPRIPISVEKVTAVDSIDIKNMLLQLLPFSSFNAIQEGTFLLPAFILACVVGAGSSVDQTASKPVILLTESLYKLFYTLMEFFTELFSIGMIAVSCYWFVTYREIFSTGIFTPLLLMLTADFFIVAFGIYPLLLHYICKDKRPYRVIYASISSILVSFFTSDTNLTLQINMRHSKESLGVHDQINGFVQPLFSIFSRGGSALIVTISFILIWRSYSSLSISVTDILWIAMTSFGLSFLLSGFSSGGTFIALTVLCTLYSRGFESGYLLLKPAAGIICSFAAAFDAVTAMYGTYAVGVKMKEIHHLPVKSFI